VPVGTTIGALLSKYLIPMLFSIAGILFILYFISGGISLMLSKGDPKAVSAGKAKITYAFIGLMVVFAAFWIVQAVGVSLKLPAITNIFGS
jgi:hypothetical protein